MNEQHDSGNDPSQPNASQHDSAGDLPLGAAFGERASQLAGRSARGLTDVRRRLERRRQRRRAMTGAGAAAVLLVGVGGLYAAGQRSDRAPAASTPSAAAPTTAAPTTALPGPGEPLWQCTGPVDPPTGAPGEFGYFSSCQPYLDFADDQGDDQGDDLGDDQGADDPATTPAPTDETAPTVTSPAPPPYTSPDTTALPQEPPYDSTTATTALEIEPPSDPGFGGSGVLYYVVKDGDSLDSIASAFQTSVDAIGATNGWRDSSHVAVAGEVIAVPVGVSIAGGLPPADGSDDDLAIGLTAPIVNGVDFNGNPVQIDALASGRSTLVVVFAHWCPHCDSTIESLRSLDESGRLPAGLDVIGVSSGEAESQPNWPAATWLEDAGWNFPVLVDPASEVGPEAAIGIGSVAQAFGVQGFPTMTLIGADGTVVDRWTGELTADELVQRLTD